MFYVFRHTYNIYLVRTLEWLDVLVLVFTLALTASRDASAPGERKRRQAARISQDHLHSG